MKTTDHNVLEEINVVISAYLFPMLPMFFRLLLKLSTMKYKYLYFLLQTGMGSARSGTLKYD